MDRLEAQIAEARQHVVVPHPARIAAELRELLTLMGKDVPRAREALAKLMPRPFQTVPETDGYRVDGGLRLGLAAPSGAAVLSSSVLTRSSSGGALPGYSETGWIPLELRTSGRAGAG